MTAREIISSYIVREVQLTQTSQSMRTCFVKGYDYGLKSPGLRYYSLRVFGYTEQQNSEFIRGMKAAHAVIDATNNDKRKRNSEDFPR